MKQVSSCAVSCVTNSRQTDHAALFAKGLLTELGSEVIVPGATYDHPAIAWKRAGLFELSGQIDGPPKMVPLPLASAADGALLALKAIAPDPVGLPQSGAQLLGERARLMGLQRNGRASPAGHCRLIDCADRRIALNLARDDDRDLLPALFQTDASDWAGIERAAANQSADVLVGRGAEMGMAIARDQVPQSGNWLRRDRIGAQANGARSNPLVVDLSALWAGPLAGNLLHHCGAQVIKVESKDRPDGARSGDAEFFDLLNSGKRCVALDFASDEGRRHLAALIEAADIVIEASRPRALRQLGVDAEQSLANRPGKVWLRILAHGDDETRIGFGDDIGVAAGLPSLMEEAWGEPIMVGDAIADPLSGIFAALAALECWQSGGGILAEVSMRDVIRRALHLDEATDLTGLAHVWQKIAEGSDLPFYPLRDSDVPAEDIGQSTHEVLSAIC